MAYRARIIDDELWEYLSFMGAVLIEGPKATGKTETAMQVARSLVRLDVDKTARNWAQTFPSLLFGGEVPRLIDEWQLELEIWNHLKVELDKRKVPGQFVLTGSSVPVDDVTRDTGAGRVMRMKMRPMTLLETGHSNGAVSLAELFQQNFSVESATNLDVPEVIDRVCIGGWPAFHALPVDSARKSMRVYLSDVAGLDVQRVSEVKYDKDNVMKVIQSLARNVGTKASINKISADAGTTGSPMDPKITADYLRALERVMLTENSPPWAPRLRSAARINGSPTRYFIDPALAVAAIGATPKTLLAGEMNTLGFLFENLVVRDLRVYMQALGGQVRQYRDSYNIEVDAILEALDGGWAAIEVKLGRNQEDAAAEGLLRFKNAIDVSTCGEPKFMAVITGEPGPAYLRKDGIYVLSIGQLGP